MLHSFLEAFMGRGFAALLRFYEANSLIINSIIAAYGLVMVLSWRSLFLIRRELIRAMVSQMRQEPGRFINAKTRHVLAKVEIPWEAALKITRFPWVAPQRAFYPRRKTVEAVQALLPAEGLAREALETLAALGGSGGTPPA